MRIFTTIITLFLCFNVFSQNEEDMEWVLGTVGGVVLNFQNGDPTVTNFDRDFSLSSANTSICDNSGEILFYSNGCQVFNKNFELLLNGDSLSFPGNPFCNANDFGSPLSQSVIIVPQPSLPGRYFLIHGEFVNSSLDTSSLFLSVIDMNANNDLGAVISKREIILSDNLSRSGFELTKHENGLDWWIIAPRFESNCYNILLLSENGIERKDVQCLGENWSANDVQGQMDISPDGNKFARFIYEHGLNIFDFDNYTGELTNPIQIEFSFTDTVYHGGVIFSPNSRFVYASAFNNVFQYDLNDSSVEESRVKIGTLRTPDSLLFKTRFKQGALAPNGKIYIGGSVQYNHLHIIHNPDCKGLASNLEQYAIRLNRFPDFCSQGIPHIPHYRNQPQEIDCDTVSIMTSISEFEFQKLEHDVYPNPVSDILYIEVADLPFGFVFKAYDVLGREILHSESISKVKQVDMGSVKQGIYFYKILDKDKIVATGKLQKL